MQEEEYWEQRAADLSRTGLDTIRASATTWASVTATLFGIVGTVGLIKAPDAIEKVGDPAKTAVTGLVLLAAVAGVASVIATGLASRGPITRVSPLTGLRLAAWTRKATGKARQRLVFGQVAGVLAALLLLAGGLVGTIAAATADPKTTKAWFVVRTADAVECGVLVRTKSGLTLEDGEGNEVLDLSSGVRDISQVTSCATAR